MGWIIDKEKVNRAPENMSPKLWACTPGLDYGLVLRARSKRCKPQGMTICDEYL